MFSKSLRALLPDPPFLSLLLQNLKTMRPYMTNNPGPVPISSLHQKGFIEECTIDDGISSNQCLLCISIKLNFFFNLLFGNPIGIHVFMDRPTSEASKQQKPVSPNFYWTSPFFKLERFNNILFIHFLFPAILWGFCPKTLFIAKFWPIWIKAAFIGGREGDRRKVWPRAFRRSHPGNGENIHCEHFSSDLIWSEHLIIVNIWS